MLGHIAFGSGAPVSTAREERASAAVPCGQWMNDPTLAMLLPEGHLWQSQSVHGQQPQWVPMTHIGEPPAAQAQRLDVFTAPQTPTEMLPAPPQPRRSVAPCTTSKAMPLSGPMPKRMPQSPARPSGPAPGQQQQQQQQPVQEEAGQPQVFSHLAEVLGQWQQQQSALWQQQTTLQQYAMTLQHLVMKQLQQEHVYKKRKLHHMPPEQVALKEQQPMATQVDKAVVLEQVPLQEQVLPTIPLLGRLEAMCSEGQDAGSASAAAASGSGAAYSASAAAAGASGGAASEGAAASSGTGPTAALWNPQRCPWEWFEELNVLTMDVLVANDAVDSSAHKWEITEEQQGHC